MAASIGGPPFAIKRTLAEKVFQNVDLYTRLPFAIKRTILIGCTGSHFRGAFLPYEADLECILGKKASPSHLEVDSEV